MLSALVSFKQHKIALALMREVSQIPIGGHSSSRVKKMNYVHGLIGYRDYCCKLKTDHQANPTPFLINNFKAECVV